MHNSHPRPCITVQLMQLDAQRLRGIHRYVLKGGVVESPIDHTAFSCTSQRSSNDSRATQSISFVPTRMQTSNSAVAIAGKSGSHYEEKKCGVTSFLTLHVFYISTLAHRR
jgi:hypothetical protein